MGRTRSGTMATRRRPSPTSSSPTAGTRLPDPRRRSRPTATRITTTARAMPTRRSRLMGMCRQSSAGSAAGSTGSDRTGVGDSDPRRTGTLRQGQADADDREGDGGDPDEQQRVVERRRDDVAEEPGQDAGPQPTGHARQRDARSRARNARPTSPTITPSSAKIRSHSLCGEPRTGSPKLSASSL